MHGGGGDGGGGGGLWAEVGGSPWLVAACFAALLLG